MSLAKATKLELINLLTAANAEREALRVTVAELQGTVEMLRKHQPAPAKPAYVRPAYVPSPEQLALREAMAAAKALAMATGRSVLVAP